MTYRINDEVIERIHDECNLIDIVSRYVELKKIGNNYVGLCPFHNEKTPSFTVSEGKQLFHCFGCGEGGDLINFIMKIENLSFMEAVKLLADLQGIPLERRDGRYDKLRLEKEKVYEINRLAARFYYRSLINNKQALKYLYNRNINNDMIKLFGLGYAPDGWDCILKHLKDKGYEERDIEKAGLVGLRKDETGYYDKFRNRIIFPIIDSRGRIVGFGGRVLDESMPKYLNSKDTIVFTKGNNLYGLNLIKKNSKHNNLILVEGYMDVLSLYRNGMDCAVASLGTAFTREQAKMLKRLRRDIYICYDSDRAGINAATKTMDILREEGMEPRVIILPKGQDPDDFINKSGVDGFKGLIKKALNFIDFKILINKSKYDLNDLEGKIKFTKKIAEILKKLNSPVEREAYINRISRETGISNEAIEQEIRGGRPKEDTRFYRDKYINGRNRHNKNKIKPIKIVLEPGHLTIEKILLKLMIEDRKHYSIVSKFLSQDDFLDSENNIIAETIFEAYENDLQLSTLDNKIIKDGFEGLEDGELNLIDDIMKQELNYIYDNKEGSIENLIKRKEYFNLRIKRKQILKNIRDIEAKKVKNKGDVKEFKSLCLQLTELDENLKQYI